MSAALELLKRETRLAWGRGGGPLVSLGFYAGVTTLLPLATGPEPARLAAGELVRDVLQRHQVTDTMKRAYLASEPGARAEWDEAREASADAYHDEAVAVARGIPYTGETGDARDANEKRLHVDTLKWAARVRNPRLYSDKATLDVNVRTVDLTRIISEAQARLEASRAIGGRVIEHGATRVLEIAERGGGGGDPQELRPAP